MAAVNDPWKFLDKLDLDLPPEPVPDVNSTYIEEMPDMADGVPARKIVVNGVEFVVAIYKADRAVEMFVPSHYPDNMSFDPVYTTGFIYDLLKTMYPHCQSPQVSVRFPKTCMDMNLADWFDGFQYRRIFSSRAKREIMDIVYSIDPKPFFVVPVPMIPTNTNPFFMYAFDFARQEPRETVRMSILSARAIEPHAIGELLVRHRDYEPESRAILHEDIKAFRVLWQEAVKLGVRPGDNWG